MAVRPAWTVIDNRVVCKRFEFKWNGGFAISQKQKNIENLHRNIEYWTHQKALEVSSKSMTSVGNDMSAFFLKLNGHTLENVFQSSKKYENGGPYLDLLNVSPKDAKRDERHQSSGALVSFVKDGEVWELEPRTAFYDYLYVSALVEKYGHDLDLSAYDWFTDIEFNPNRSINCQARSAAIYKLLQANNIFDSLTSKDKWILFHKEYVKG